MSKEAHIILGVHITDHVQHVPLVRELSGQHGCHVTNSHLVETE